MFPFGTSNYFCSGYCSMYRTDSEKGEWIKTDTNLRKCTMCDANSIGDESDNLECTHFANDEKVNESKRYHEVQILI